MEWSVSHNFVRDWSLRLEGIWFTNYKDINMNDYLSDDGSISDGTGIGEGEDKKGQKIPIIRLNFQISLP